MNVETTYTIVGEIIGTYWWPIGQEWEKPVCETFTEAGDLDRLHDFHDERPQRLRTLLEAVTIDGDSSSGCRLSAESVLIVRRTRRSNGSTVTRERTIALVDMPSAKDYVAEVV